MKKISFFLFGLLLISCNTTKTYFQVYKTESQTVKKTNTNSIVFEDNNCTISYNLWQNNGNAGFSFFNKTDETIYLLLDESFYVINGNAYDYFQNRVFVSSNSSTSQQTSSVSYGKIGFLQISNYASKSLINNSTNGTEVFESKVVAVPPKASKSISEFIINETIFRDCNMLRFPSSKQTSSKSFTESASPLKFYNSICYKIGEKETKIKVKNDFYVSEITNLSENEIMTTQKDQFCDQRGANPVKVFKDNSPDKFYVQYIKSQMDTWKY
ncbi:hypothetical protein ACFO3U_03405 [Flavobacterium ponti]|uniref:Lipoprotein n=1 Tax=Flavobacterium ponti TaxID=665133 RepID=A0ABV9P0C1_9FLAO